MLQYSRWTTSVVLLVCLVGVLIPVPSFLSDDAFKQLPGWARNRINLGLDLRGGAHLLFQIDTDEVKKDWLENLRDEARRRLREVDKLELGGITTTGGRLAVKIVDPAKTDAALRALQPLAQDLSNPLFGTTGADLKIESTEPGQIVATPTEAGIANRLTTAIETSRETINRRINSLGTTESSVVRQGRDRILIQYPGLQETGPLKDLVGKTARLSFHEVYRGAADPSQPRPIGFKYYESEEDGRTQGQLLLRETPIVRGEELSSAQFRRDDRTNQPIIAFTFNNAGARKFGKFTEEHVDEPFAIVLDDKVISAPRINEPIRTGSGQISGGFTAESANLLAVQLRSGALPAKLTVVEERVVGASLGQDSIDAGVRAGIVATFLVVGFMVFAYGLFGVFAVIAGAINILLVFAAMALFGSTLTLPGIAGLVLTVGMSVDSNVLIYERIREELRNGRTPITAIDSGLRQAFGTIFDSQLTTLIAGILMFWLGSGPVRGFAVTLTLGIITAFFTAFLVTRLLVVLWLRRYKPSQVPAPL